MMKRLFFSVVCSLCAAAALVFLPSCEKAEPEQKEEFGSMSITSEPSGAEISILGKVIGTTPRVTNPVPAAMYIVKFSMDGYEPAWLPVNIVPGRQVDVHATLVQEKATVVIDSDPPGAHVQMGDRDLGDTPVILPALSLGSYSGSVYLEGYARRPISWNVRNARPILIKVSLKDNFGILSLTSEPDTAEIEIDGRSFGTTPFKEELEQGRHLIRLKKDGYKPYETMVSVRRDETVTENAVLEMLPGTLSLTSEPDGAAVFIDDIEYGETPFVRKNMQAGDYAIRLTKNGFDPVEQTVSIHPGEITERSFTLDANTGSIVLAVNPPGINIYLDGKFICRTEVDSRNKSRDLSKNVTIKNVSAGQHTITLKNKFAKPAKKEMQVMVGKGRKVQVQEFTFWLPDTKLVLKNGSEYTGRLDDKYAEDSKKLSFRHSPGIISEYNRSEIREIVPLNIIDKE